MKKLILSLLAAASVASVSAADFGITAGIGAAKISADNYVKGSIGSLTKVEFDYEGVFAWNVGMKVNQDFSSNVFGEASLLFQRQGFSSQLKGKSFLGDASGEKYNTNLYYLNLPINAGYKFNLGSDFSIAPKAGLLLGFGLTGSDGSNDGCNPFSDLKDESYGFFSNFQRFDAGLSLGVNFNLKQFQLGTQYTWSFPEFCEQVPDSKNRVFTANLAYFF